MGEAALTAFRLPEDPQPGVFSDDHRPLSPTTQVAAIKGSFGKAVGQAQVGDPKGAIQTLTPVLTFLKGPDVNVTDSRECAFWSEQVLAKAAVLAGDTIHKNLYADDSLPEFALEAFRLWSAHPDVHHRSPTTTEESDTPGCAGSPATIWKAYYDFLSDYLQRDLFSSLPGERPIRSRFLDQFKKVQDTCKTVVLDNTKFPSADEKNEYIENWVEQVIMNWKVLCGPAWQSSDIKNGGQNAISINVLDILYGAAAKTFHSLLILRRLFHLHSALAEFDLAMSALDTYITLYERNKERAKKTSAYTRTTENDEVFGRTICEAILMLCCFGRFKEAERAKDLAEMIQDVLIDDSESFAPENLAFFHHAIGVGLANWARWTPVNESRADIQVSALEFLQKSLYVRNKGQKDLNAAYSLGLLLAETRNLQVAIEVVREALKETDSSDSLERIDSQLSPFMLQRYTLPLWHLLTLLLSAQQNFEAAYRACEAGLQVIDAICTSPERPSHRALNESDAVSSRSWIASPAEEVLRVEMEAREKERIIELRMTQISLDEILDGPNTAAQSIDSLLAMFHKLFDDINFSAQNAPIEPPKTHLQPPQAPKSAAASSRGSIFSRRKTSRASKVPEVHQSVEVSEKPTQVKLNKSQAERHGLGVLIKLYIFIARIRRHAKQFEEAEKACLIAEKYATCIEELVARPEGAFPHGFEDERWGFCQVPDELWADVLAERGALSQEQSHSQQAMKHYEEALIYSPDHLTAIVGLCNLLLDSSDESLPVEDNSRPSTSLSSDFQNLALTDSPVIHGRTPQTGLRNTNINLPNDNDPSPEALDRLAARDRAFGLLSTLTKLGTAWDNSEAWFALARAYEQGGQLERAREILWWCIELEDKKPIRHWSNLGSGGYVL